MTRIMTATAAALLMTTGAFAQSSALDVREQFSAYVDDDPTVLEIMMDEQGMDRTDADYEQRMAAATMEQKKLLGSACSEVDLAQEGISDKIRERCENIAESMN